MNKKRVKDGKKRQNKIETIINISEMKQSSIEFIVDNLLLPEYGENPEWVINIIQQAEEMHKQEMIEAWCNGYDEEDRATSNPLTYYNNTYEKDN